MKKSTKTAQLDPAAICRSSDPLAVRELLTKIGDKWTIFRCSVAQPPRWARPVF